tara:strand:- start:4133 stop:4783 length:651 start_codon:yes stop_codon:yes gene_type:complete
MSDKDKTEEKMIQKPNENQGVLMEGHIKIFDPETKKVYIDKRNAIHYENMSISLAESLGNEGKGNIVEMAFGNGGTTVDPTGIITYLTPNNVGVNASLYNQTYYKTVDDNNVNNTDPSRNFIETRHTLGTTYTDILVSCLLDYGEPSGQQAFDNSTDMDGNFVFDELGLKAYNPSGANIGRLLTHVVFHPVQKSLNRLIQIDYTIRVQSLTNISEI